MWTDIVVGIIIASSVTAIRVPVNNEVENESSTAVPTINEAHVDPSYFLHDDKSYLIPREPQRDADIILEVAPEPVTYLLPPLSDKQADYQQEGTDAGQQGDWYPIAQLTQNTPDLLPIILPEVNETEALNIFKNTRNGKVLYDPSTIPTLSTKLEPPAPGAPNDYQVVNLSDEQKLPKNSNQHVFETTNQHLPLFLSDQNHFVPNLQRFYKQKLISGPQILPFKPILSKYKTPTKFYPKKYTVGFRPIPIPISQFADDSLDEVPKARPLQPFHPVLKVTDEFQTPSSEKNNYASEQAEKKQKDTEANIAEKNHSLSESTNNELKLPTNEQQASEVYFRYPERSVAFEPTRQESPRPTELKEYAPPPTGERTEFRMHGMKGPHSYQFGYDTGKGKNRQFRYEERDNDGHVRGHYGYMDKNGKLRVVNYDADPEHGFRAEAPVEKDQ